MEQNCPQGPLRAALYARCRMEDALDLSMQGHALASLAESRGWTVVLRELEQAPEAATRLPARERLLRAVQRGGVDVVVAWKLDRLARSFMDLVRLLERWQAEGVHLVTLADDVDFAGPRGAELWRLFRVLAALNRTTHRDQIKVGMKEASAEGRPIGRPATALIHRDTARTLAQAGHSQRDIARRLGLHPKTVARLLAED